MRVFLDANILFSAAKSDGAVRALVRLLLEQSHECWVDAYVVAEARRNLAHKGPQAVEAFEALLGHLHTATAVAGAAEAAGLDWLPAKDRPVRISRHRGHPFHGIADSVSRPRRTPFHADRGQRFSVKADSGDTRG